MIKYKKGQRIRIKNLECLVTKIRGKVAIIFGVKPDYVVVQCNGTGYALLNNQIEALQDSATAWNSERL